MPTSIDLHAELEQLAASAEHLYQKIGDSVDTDVLRAALHAKRVVVATCEKAIAVANARAQGVEVSDVVAEVEKTTPQQASTMVLAALRNNQFPQLRDLWATGQISEDSRKQAVTTLMKLRNCIPAEEFDNAQNSITEAAHSLRGEALTRQLETIIKHYQPQIDHQAHVRRKRYLTFQAVPGGWKFHGLLPKDEGDTVRQALGEIARQARAKDLQNPKSTRRVKISTRLVDALTHLCVQFHTTLVQPQNLHPIRETNQKTGTGLDPSQWRSHILRTYDGRYDLGRSQRLADPKLRALVLARDGGCIFPHCDAIPTTCEIAHIIPWREGGPTNLTNLASLCPHHHWIIDNTRSEYELTLAPENGPTVKPIKHHTVQRE